MFVNDKFMKKILAMKEYVSKIALFAVFSFVLSVVTGISARAQQQEMTPEERAKKLDEYIQKKVEKMEITLQLEFWQVFLVDSVFNHDYFAMNDEAEKFRVEKVSNSDIYVASQDKWSERIDSSLRKILTDEQWEKYMKGGARKEAIARQKRREKASKAAKELKEGGK